MRICCFANCMRTGGAEKVAAQLIGHWNMLGHETVLITAEPKAEREYDCRYIARETLAREWWVDVETMSGLYEKYHFDVVVFNGGVSRKGFGNVVDMLKARGVRTIMILHHTANNWMYTLGSSEDLWADDDWRKLDVVVCVDRMWALWWKYRGVNAVFIQNPVNVEGMRDERGEMRDEKRGMRKRASSHIPHTSSLTLVKRVDEAVERLRGKKNIIWVGRLNDPLKRPELAVEVFSKLVCEFVSEEVEECPTLTMLGACDKAVEKRLRKCFVANIFRAFKTSQTSQTSQTSKPPKPSKLSEPPKLFFPGFVTNVGDYLSKADAHLFTSATEVTVPQAILEANAMGVETVAFDIPVLREGLGGLEGMGGLEGKWKKVLAGECVECDFDTPEVHQRLMDELQFSQQWFASHYLPQLHTFRKLKARLNPAYLVSRLSAKLRRRH